MLLVIVKKIVKWQKIPYIPPVLHNSRFTVNFKEEGEVFNTFFTKQCSLLDNICKLPLHSTLLNS